MFRAVAVDDESFNIILLEKALEKTSNVTLIKSYTDPFLACEEILMLNPDIVFVDLQMPVIDGKRL